MVKDKCFKAMHFKGWGWCRQCFSISSELSGMKIQMLVLFLGSDCVFVTDFAFRSILYNYKNYL